jgi:XRE family transcriptional regulator, aerobic/anaerobic benzoate catabolism transcriptional regulator
MTSRERAPSPLLLGLGRVVRGRRNVLGLTLRALSERAKVSERFLAQLEAGEGNISVVRLHDVALALETTAAALLAEAPARARGEAPPRTIALLGLRGAGKTTIGRRVAHALTVPFVELDAQVEQRTGTALRALFELHGAQYFRETERAVLREVLSRGEPVVLATSGGIVTDFESFERLRRETLTIWLKARPEDHWDRVVAQGDARPMANRSDAMDDMRKLLLARGPLYERAHHVVDTSALGLEGTVAAVIRLAHEAAAARRQP